MVRVTSWLMICVPSASVTTQRTVTLSDFDSTVVDPMPEADRTYDQMGEDEQLKLDAIAKQIEGEDEAESSSDAAETE